MKQKIGAWILCTNEAKTINFLLFLVWNWLFFWWISVYLCQLDGLYQQTNPPTLWSSFYWYIFIYRCRWPYSALNCQPLTPLTHCLWLLSVIKVFVFMSNVCFFLYSSPFLPLEPASHQQEVPHMSLVLLKVSPLLHEGPKNQALGFYSGLETFHCNRCYINKYI